MNFKRNRSIIDLDDVNQLPGEVIKLKFKPMTIYGASWFNYLYIALFVSTDFYFQYILFDNSSYLDFAGKVITSLAFATLLDIPLSIAASVIKEHNAGYRTKSDTVVISSLAVLVFALTFAVQLYYKLNLPDCEDRLLNLITGVSPFLTSIATFLSTYYSYCPARKGLENDLTIWNILHTLMVKLHLAKDEVDADQRKKVLHNSEEIKHDDAYAEIDSAVSLGENACRQAIAEKISDTPEQVETIMSK